MGQLLMSLPEEKVLLFFDLVFPSSSFSTFSSFSSFSSFPSDKKERNKKEQEKEEEQEEQEELDIALDENVLLQLCFYDLISRFSKRRRGGRRGRRRRRYREGAGNDNMIEDEEEEEEEEKEEKDEEEGEEEEEEEEEDNEEECIWPEFLLAHRNPSSLFQDEEAVNSLLSWGNWYRCNRWNGSNRYYRWNRIE